MVARMLLGQAIVSSEENSEESQRIKITWAKEWPEVNRKDLEPQACEPELK